jgi:hypothetical protein
VTLPARDRAGPLGNLVVPAGGTREFRDFRPARPPTKFAITLRTDQPVTLSIFRLDDYGEASLHVPPISISAMGPTDDENTTIFDYPLSGQGIRPSVHCPGGTPANVRMGAAAAGASAAGA